MCIVRARWVTRPGGWTRPTVFAPAASCPIQQRWAPVLRQQVKRATSSAGSARRHRVTRSEHYTMTAKPRSRSRGLLPTRAADAVSVADRQRPPHRDCAQLHKGRQRLRAGRDDNQFVLPPQLYDQCRLTDRRASDRLDISTTARTHSPASEMPASQVP